MPENLEHKVTRDGSSTLYAPNFDEHYHSLHGAIQESMYVFIEKGLRQLPDLASISILEMGFGTGLNALLTYQDAREKEIHYTSVELYPLTLEQAASLNYAKETGEEDAEEIFQKLHQAQWEEYQHIGQSFHLKKIKTEFQNFFPDRKFDLVYFDAFAPAVQPDLWSDEIMERMFQVLNPGGVFVTYSAKGSVKRGLIKAGFEVEKLPGPPGKREMLRGTHPLNPLSSVKKGDLPIM